jgi:hypothetical protein
VSDKDRFIKDVKEFDMKIYQDSGVFRHIEFSKNGTWNHRFFLTTWPDHLCISGDMGTYVFSRIKDMFCFFRSENDLNVNTGYWTEKLESTDTTNGHKEYSVDRFNAAVVEDFEQWEFESEEQKEEVLEDLKDNLLDQEFEIYAFHKAADYESPYGHTFSDFWENHLTRSVYQYTWCLHAIVWGIQKYDNNRNSTSYTAADAEREGVPTEGSS